MIFKRYLSIVNYCLKAVGRIAFLRKPYTILVNVNSEVSYWIKKMREVPNAAPKIENALSIERNTSRQMLHDMR